MLDRLITDFCPDRWISRDLFRHSRINPHVSVGVIASRLSSIISGLDRFAFGQPLRGRSDTYLIMMMIAAVV